ncbi:hypothetical protein SORBI_3004G271350 [Sorghum bicolor]|nr:hypothetical protein SORBI_3004G271350 [Sorghum bicolor]
MRVQLIFHLSADSEALQKTMVILQENRPSDRRQTIWGTCSGCRTHLLVSGMKTRTARLDQRAQDYPIPKLLSYLISGTEMASSVVSSYKTLSHSNEPVPFS